MHSRFYTFLCLSVMATLVTGCTSLQQATSAEPLSESHPQNDVTFTDRPVEALTLPTIMKDSNGKPFVCEKRVPKNVIKLNVGPSLVCSDVQTANRLYEYKMGLDYGIEYQHLWRSGFGAGATFYLFNAPFGRDLDMEIKYMGPAVSYSGYLDDKELVRGEFVFGLGCGILKEKGLQETNTETDFAAMIGMGLEYAVAKHIAFGVQCNWNPLFMFEPKGYYFKKEDLYGIERVSILAGVRVYF